MIEMFTAATEEVDYVETAVAEIIGGLRLEGRLKKNSIGILHCYVDFIDSGVVRALAQALPFDVIGFSTTDLAAPGFVSPMGLILTVLTSDDVSFHAGISEPVADDVGAPLDELYSRLVIPLPEKPKLLLPMPPYITSLALDEFVAKLNELAQGIPFFGSLPASNEPDLSRCYTIFRGEAYDDRMVLTAVCGNVEPLFFTASILEENILKPSATVTGSHKNLLLTLDGKSAEDYLVEVGLIQKGGMTSLVATPFCVTLADGTRLIRTCLMGNDAGQAVMCGHIPEGAKISFAVMGPDDIIRSSSRIIAQAAETAAGRGVLIYSCVVRNWAMGANSTAEMEKSNELISGKSPFFHVTSGGEISPQWLADGKVVNYLQNDSMIICIL